MTETDRAVEAGQAACRRKDYKTALELWRPLAAAGNSDAQLCLGALYQTGIGIPQDYAEALKWYRKAADQLNPRATGSIGKMYELGTGVKQDYIEALKWYHKAADLGDRQSPLALCYFYYKSIGTKQDYAAAYLWGSLGFSLIPSLATEELGSPSFKDQAAKHLTTAQIAAIDKRVQEWKSAIMPPPKK